MKRVLLILMLCTVSFASYEAFEKARFTFPHKVLNVERHYFEDRWIHEVTCSNYVYLIIDDTVDTNYVENIYKGDVLACGDSIVAVTKEYSGDSVYCKFQKIYPANSYIDRWAGTNFAICLWSDSFGEITYVCDIRQNYYDMISAKVRKSSDLSILDDYTELFYLVDDVVRYGDTVICLTHMFAYEDNTGYGYVEQENDYYRYDRKVFVDGRYQSGKQVCRDGNYIYRELCSMTAYTSIENTYTYESRIGHSMLDFNDDGIADFFSFRNDTYEFLRWNCPGVGGEGYSLASSETGVSIYGLVVDNIEDSTVLSSHFYDETFFAGNFIDDITACLVRGEQIFMGDSFTDSTSLTGLDIGLINGLSDIDNDGIHEFYDISNTELIFYSLNRNFELAEAWNLVTPPLILADSLLSSVFPTSLSGYFRYDAESHAYTETNYFQQGKGVFVYNLEAEILDLSGDPIETVSLDIRDGWNMFGGPSHAVQASAILEDSMIVPPLYILNPATSTYEEAEVIYPGQGFWLLSTEDHVLEVE